MHYEDWIYHPSRMPKHEPELGKALEALRPQFMLELDINLKTAEYLAPYDPKWVQKFKTDYVNAKCQAIRYSQYTIARAEKVRELRYREDTEKVFDVILQKKLFNLQLLWHAEQASLPGSALPGIFTIGANTYANALL